METLTLEAFGDVYRGCRVLVTGHTGFKGSWLALWLTELGAEVAGYSLDVPTEPSHFKLLGLEKRLRHFEGDIRDRNSLGAVLDEFRPQIVFHLAAQALVRESYVDPVTTFEANAMGMVNVLDAIRTRPYIKTAILITSDKAYRNDEWYWGYREIDALGGKDPYSASKSCADLIAQSFYHSFLKGGPTRVAITRAGNVIGGGDWAADRIVPDCIRAWGEGESVVVRSPKATRPWQHVLEPVGGYLWLGAKLIAGGPGLDGEAFNFGPDAKVIQSVADLLEAMKARWPGATWHVPEGLERGGEEATFLKLSCDKALAVLGWSAILQFDETVSLTVDWYRAWDEGGNDMRQASLQQIRQYAELASARGAPWVKA